jgi:hypothetical protein
MLTAQLRHAPLTRQQLQYDLTLELWGKLASLVHLTLSSLEHDYFSIVSNLRGSLH